MKLWPILLVVVALGTVVSCALVARIDDGVAVDTPAHLNPSPESLDPRALAFVAPLEALRPTTTSTTTPRSRKRSQALTEPQRGQVFDAAYATEVAQLIREGFARFGPDVAEQAVSVAWCESRHVPTARKGMHTGLFQLGRRWHEALANSLGYSWDDMWSARPNIAVAAALYETKGWQPWECKP